MNNQSLRTTTLLGITILVASLLYAAPQTTTRNAPQLNDNKTAALTSGSHAKIVMPKAEQTPDLPSHAPESQYISIKDDPATNTPEITLFLKSSPKNTTAYAAAAALCAAVAYASCTVLANFQPYSATPTQSIKQNCAVVAVLPAIFGGMYTLYKTIDNTVTLYDTRPYMKFDHNGLTVYERNPIKQAITPKVARWNGLLNLKINGKELYWITITSGGNVVSSVLHNFPSAPITSLQLIRYKSTGLLRSKGCPAVSPGLIDYRSCPVEYRGEYLLNITAENASYLPISLSDLARLILAYWRPCEVKRNLID